MEVECIVCGHKFEFTNKNQTDVYGNLVCDDCWKITGRFFELCKRMDELSGTGNVSGVDVFHEG